MLTDPKFLMKELKTLFDGYLVNVNNERKDEHYETDFERSKSVLYDFLFHLKEMTPEYKALVELRDKLAIELFSIKKELEQEGVIE